MDKKSKIFFSIFFLAVFIVTALAFYKFYILKDYYIKLEAACDPAAEKCFIYECDPADDDQCPQAPNERVSYYKIIEKKASDLPLCDPNDAGCPPITCRTSEDCQETLCDQAAEAAGERCSDPEAYLKNIGEAENNSGCASGEENCAANDKASPDENGQGNAANSSQVQNNSGAEN